MLQKKKNLDLLNGGRLKLFVLMPPYLRPKLAHFVQLDSLHV